jgi:hypothetical protein
VTARTLTRTDATNVEGDGLVLAYDLTTPTRPPSRPCAIVPPGQVLLERATCWTDPPRVTADVSGLLGQMVVPPWGAQLRRLEDGIVG